ncbi:unnamed protein product [Tuber melanosporum]|uniref:Sugar phosphate phosphatase n=1 Tax=Tuber melanosporum (strain Mel28) TaxID=656061 RepID=D5GEJ9_TUBMM|nr:uncharacterized protein GSTUM_00006527001 [Tuber melanosporum]CAZ82942.1 unnamed protein product [Tuber melanosporum]
MDPGLPKEPYRISDKNSFAYVSARDRWPVILTQAVDDVFKHGDSEDSNHRHEGSKIIRQIAQLKFELQHDRLIRPLEDDGGDDIKGYNEELEKLGNPKWFDAPWLFAECYLYRRLNTFFTNSKTWKTHDVFHVQKATAFRSSRAAVLELASRYRQLVSSLKNSEQPTGTKEATEEGEKKLFTDMCEICLWGNATDLSLLTSLTYADLQQLQGSRARKAASKYILDSQVDKVYELLKKQRDEGKVGRVDIVLDNSGFELFVDLIFGGYLLTAGFATEIVFHPKSLPWFVSDVLPGDFTDLINALRDPESDLKFLFSEWSELHTNGKFLLRPNRFWTTAASYWRLPSAAPRLFEDLKQSELVIFKGDLNYRKLTADAAWDPTTDFSEAIGELGKLGSGVRVLALRTCKADVVVGLSEGKDLALRSGDPEEGKRKWAWSGKWAVIQFWDGKL